MARTRNDIIYTPMTLENADTFFAIGFTEFKDETILLFENWLKALEGDTDTRARASSGTADWNRIGHDTADKLYGVPFMPLL